MLSKLTAESELTVELMNMFQDVARAITHVEYLIRSTKLDDPYYAVDQAAKLLRETISSVRSLRGKIDPLEIYPPQFRTILDKLDLVSQAIHPLLINDCKEVYAKIINAQNTPGYNPNASVNAIITTRHAYYVLTAVYRACAAAVKGVGGEVGIEVQNVETDTRSTRHYATETKKHAKNVIDFRPLWFSK
ncbi:MAG: hypothetical protein K2X94_04670 [Amoebophilaceae bacterium]|nr:hypothetical protein [Amoebophilaceae bacterium]